MAILINDTTPRVQYTATSGQTVFTVSFEFFENADLKVYKNSTLLTLTTHYTVTGAGVTGGGSITLVTGATAGDVLTITRDIAVKRVTDFPTSGPFNVDALNTDLDRLTAMMQERENGLTRVIQLSETDAAVNLQLPIAASRASKVLGFDTTGNAIAMQELGNYRGNWAATTAYVLRDIVKDTSNSNIYICITAHTSAGSQPISSNADSAKWALIVDAAAAATSASNAATSETNAAASASVANEWATKTAGPVAGGEYSAKYHAQAAATSASNASTSASNADTAKVAAQSAQSAAESARDATLAAYDNFDDRYLGTKTSDPTLDNDGNALVAGALYFNSVLGEMRLYTGSAWVAAYVSGAGFLALSGGTMTGAVNVVAGSAAAPGIAASGDTNTGIFFPAADTIAFTEGGVEAMRINNLGQVGIGTGSSSLTKPLSIQASEPVIQLIDDDLTTRVANIGGQNGNVTIDIDPAAAAAASQFAINIDNTERLRIAASGQIGIGGANYGTSGQVLTSNGSGAAPSWASPASTGVNVQTFTSSGTWTKPSLAAGSRVLIQAWGGGGGGGRGTSFGGGGGGGGYNERWLTLSSMGATETITIGAGGAARTTDGAGNDGGNTTAGSLITAYGGGGGAGSGGGGGGQLSAGQNANTGGTSPGKPRYLYTTDGTGNDFWQGSGGVGTFGGSGYDAFNHGGGGGANNGTYNGGNTVWGGGGGAGRNTGTAGTSSFGGNGGGVGLAGTQPGGGGGGVTGANSGAGGAGQVIITVFPA